MKHISFSVPVFYNDSIEVEDDADEAVIRAAIAEALPKYASVRLWEGSEQDAEWEVDD